MANKSKNKGKTFEREIANYLSELYNSSFTRVPYSGAYTGGKNSFRKDSLTEGQVRSHKGDIIPPDHWIKFNCECKHYVSFPFHKLLFHEPIPLLENWIDQLMDAADPGDFNILLIKITRTGRFVVYESSYDFSVSRFIDYTDRNGKTWRITEFNKFFELNQEDFQKANIGTLETTSNTNID